MNNRKLIITYIPDVLHMIEHNGSFKGNKEDNLYPALWSNDFKGLTARSERESFRNIKTIEAAQKIVSKRKEVLLATYNGTVIHAQTK